MSTTTRRRVSDAESRTKPLEEGGSSASSTTATRADVDRLFAVAAKSFESMSEGNSQQFLKRSRQTGGQ